MKMYDVMHKIINWYGENTSSMYRVNDTENYHEL